MKRRFPRTRGLYFFYAKQKKKKKVTIHGSSGSPETGNLNKHIHNDATASYNNVKNYALHTTLNTSPRIRGSCQPLFQTSKSYSSILAEKPLDKNSTLPPAKSSFRHHPICCRANRHHSNVPRFVSRCSCLVFHEVGWSSIACSKRLLVTRVVGLSAPPPPSLPLNAFYLIAFRSIAKIFSWRCDSHFQSEFLAHLARVNSNLWKSPAH